MDNQALSLQERDFLSYLDHRSVVSSGAYPPFYKRPTRFTNPSKNLVNAAIVAFVGAVFFVVSFTSPYWLQSYAYTYNTFLNMGLWEFCFNGYRHFDFQYDKKYDGCNHIFSYDFQQIREWILPGWLIATQAFASLCLVSLVTSLATLSLLLMRWPLKYVMRQEWKLIGFSFCCQATFVASMLLTLVIFGTMCWSRSWLLFPNFNYLSWSYIFAVISGGFEVGAALMLFYESQIVRDRRREMMSELQMEPQGSQYSVPNGSEAHGYI